MCENRAPVQARVHFSRFRGYQNVNQNLPNCLPASIFCSNCSEDNLLRLPNRFLTPTSPLWPPQWSHFASQNRQNFAKILKRSRKNDEKIVSGRAPVLNWSHKCFQDPSRALQRPPGELPEAFSGFFLHIFPRFNANLSTLTHFMRNLSQQPTRSAYSRKILQSLSATFSQ